MFEGSGAVDKGIRCSEFRIKKQATATSRPTILDWLTGVVLDPYFRKVNLVCLLLQRFWCFNKLSYNIKIFMIITYFWWWSIFRIHIFNLRYLCEFRQTFPPPKIYKNKHYCLSSTMFDRLHINHSIKTSVMTLTHEQWCLQFENVYQFKHTTDCIWVLNFGSLNCFLQCYIWIYTCRIVATSSFGK